MVRSARILRVTRVAARLDCLQRLSNAARVCRAGKTNTCDQLVQDKPLCVMQIYVANSELYEVLASSCDYVELIFSHLIN